MKFLKFLLGWAIVFAVVGGLASLYQSGRENHDAPGAISPLMYCTQLTDNRASIQCMAKNCLFDDPALNDAHCNGR